MGNISCFQCSDAIKRTRKITVLGKEILSKNYICSRDGEPYQEKPADTKLQLAISPTSYCSAHCPFCIAKNTKENQWVDLKKLEHVLHGLNEEGLVRGISFSGGEPFTDVGVLNEIVNMIYEIFGYHIEVSISTNGSKLEKIHDIEKLSYLDCIHISRHHYDDQKNAELFGIKVPTKEELKEIVGSISFQDVFVFNCLLLKDYIGTREEVHRYLDFAIEVGVMKSSFITATPVNDFVKDRMVAFEDVISRKDSRLLMTRSYQDFEFCHCQDGIYVSQDGVLEEFYGRCTSRDGLSYTRSMVYGPDNHLRSNYDGDIIV